MQVRHSAVVATTPATHGGVLGLEGSEDLRRQISAKTHETKDAS